MAGRQRPRIILPLFRVNLAYLRGTSGPRSGADRGRRVVVARSTADEWRGAEGSAAGRGVSSRRRRAEFTKRSQFLELGFHFQLHFILDAIITGQPADELAALPVIENAAETFAGNAGHCREIALADLLVDHDAAGAKTGLAFLVCGDCPR